MKRYISSRKFDDLCDDEVIKIMSELDAVSRVRMSVVSRRLRGVAIESFKSIKNVTVRHAVSGRKMESLVKFIKDTVGAKLESVDLLDDDMEEFGRQVRLWLPQTCLNMTETMPFVGVDYVRQLDGVNKI